MKKDYKLENCSFIFKIKIYIVCLLLLNDINDRKNQGIKEGLCSMLNHIEYNNFWFTNDNLHKLLSKFKDYYYFKNRRNVPDKYYWWYSNSRSYDPNHIVWLKPRENFVKSFKRIIWN